MNRMVDLTGALLDLMPARLDGRLTTNDAKTKEACLKALRDLFKRQP